MANSMANSTINSTGTPHLQSPAGPAGGAEAAACLALGPVGPIRPSGELIICERRIKIDAPLVNWQDAPQFSAYRLCGYRGAHGEPPGPYPFNPARGMERRLSRYRLRKELQGRRNDEATLKRLIRQCVIHHDGAESSADCFHILHDERGLSAHFLVDNDGTIYQTLDLGDLAFHAQSANSSSIGIEVCNRGRVELPSSAASRRGRDAQRVSIHGYDYLAWTFTEAQYISLGKLLRALLRIFPLLPCAYPRDAGLIQTALAQPERFAGVLGHYHLSLRKWDPGCFDFDRLVRSASSRVVWFASARAVGDQAPGGVAVDATDAARRAELLRSYEQLASGGHFPVGPCGEELVWHGGVHLLLPRGSALRSPLPGRIVAARLDRSDGAVGSANFVLLRHLVMVRAQPLVFYLLLFHLEGTADKPPEKSTEQSGANEPDWLQRARASGAPVQPLRSGVWFPDIEVTAGELLGRTGTAGPASARAPQIHIEVMAEKELTAALSPGQFQVRDCASTGLVCLDPVLKDLVGGAARDLASVFRGSGPKPAALRRLAIRAPSEWRVLSAREWEQQLSRSPSFQRAQKDARDQIYCEQIAPYAWLDAEVARRVGLPADGVVWHYHPTELLAWIADQLGRSQPEPGAAVKAVTTGGSAGAPAAPAPAADGANGDEGYANEEDLADGDLGDGELSFEQIARGYPKHWLKTGR